MASIYAYERRYTVRVSSPISGTHIRRLRLRAGFQRQQDLARKAGIDASKISMLENDKRVNFTLDSLERLAAALRVTVGNLFELDSPPPITQNRNTETAPPADIASQNGKTGAVQSQPDALLILREATTELRAAARFYRSFSEEPMVDAVRKTATPRARRTGHHSGTRKNRRKSA